MDGTMVKQTIICYTLILTTCLTTSSPVFHENTKIVFQPEYDAEYFGYSIVLSPEGLIVGAPKASDPDAPPSIKPGVVFNCSLSDFDVKNVSCTPFKKVQPGLEYATNVLLPGFIKDDMWFGAAMALLPNGRLMINAPRWTSPYGKKHLLMNGATFMLSRKESRAFYPLKEYNRQAYVTDGERREYGEYGTHLNFYAYGQAGMSVAVTKLNTVILGAPGLLQWTGGIVGISFYPNSNGTYMYKLPTANPYLTKDLGPDEYFGYSVESGVFEKYGSVMYVAGAPRHNIATGKVLIFEPPMLELKSLTIKAKILGPQSGAYFGASLCCTDINGDGLDDLLVGAPTYVKSDGGLPYDQGAVFIYMAQEQDSGFVLEEYGHVSGSNTNGAWFGMSIADLGDIDGDGFKDIAIGAPWEDDGNGAVYIYKGYAKGLNTENVQRIQPEGVNGFGWSIAKGVDMDKNNCSDLAIGAHNSQMAYLYRCIPTMRVHAVIRVPDAINLPQNTTEFAAEFCVTAPLMETWPHVEIHVIGHIEVDPEFNRAMLSGDYIFTKPVRVKPGNEICDEQTIDVNPEADWSKPISLIFKLEPQELMQENTTTFLMEAARVSEHSTLETSFLIQLVRDCGEDLICTPWLVMTLEPLDNPYIPGSDTKLGMRIIIFNKEEPAYGAKVNITLPMPPKRIPSECSLEELNMECNVPAPLLRGDQTEWEIELDYNTNNIINITEDTALDFKAELSDPLYRNITNDNIKEIVIQVKHEANFSISGKAMPNASIAVSRDNLEVGANVTFKHYFEITNLGPSDASALLVKIIIPDRTNISSNISGCELDSEDISNASAVYKCVWSIPAKVSYPVSVPLQMDLSKQGEFLKENFTFNATTHVIVHMKNNLTHFEVTTTLILEPVTITWKLILICVLLGLLLLGVIVTILYKRGFFKRTTHKMLQEQKDKQNHLLQESDTSSAPDHGEDDDDDYPPFDSED